MLRLDCVSIKNQPQSARAVLNPGCSDSAPAEYCVGGFVLHAGRQQKVVSEVTSGLTLGFQCSDAVHFLLWCMW